MKIRLKGDCLDLMGDIKSNSIDLIIADLPYQTTNCRWDKMIPLNDYVIIDGKLYYQDDFLIKEFKNENSYLHAIEVFNKNKR